MPYKDSEAKRKYDKEYRLKNLERLREYDCQRNPERYKKNPEGNRAKRIRYYYRHRELELSRKRVSDEKERLQMSKDFRFNRRYIARMWRSAKHRAKVSEVPFDISPDDIVIPEFCPVFGIRLEVNKGEGFQPSSPSLDRIIPSLGYTRGNVQVISYRANELKRDASLDELKMLVCFLEKNNTRTNS
jgi:hypothetical protein